MDPKECFWLADGQWLFQAVDVAEHPLGEPVKVALGELVFHHDQDEELH